MTENERVLRDIIIDGNGFDYDESIPKSIFEEIQQYRALEEKLNGISVEQVVNGFISTVEKETQEGYERGRILTNKEADEWNELQAIGTIEEFKVLKEKSVETLLKDGQLLYQQGLVDGYAKAIDEFLHNAETKIYDRILQNQARLDFASGLSVANRILDEIAEQMKGDRR